MSDENNSSNAQAKFVTAQLQQQLGFGQGISISFGCYCERVVVDRSRHLLRRGCPGSICCGVRKRHKHWIIQAFQTTVIGRVVRACAGIETS